MLNKRLQFQLLKMAKEDQSLRRYQWKKQKLLRDKYFTSDVKKYKLEITKLVNELNRRDTVHIQVIKKLVKKHGWPGNNLVGKRGSYATWLLIQHAVKDRSFQKKCRTLLEHAVAANDADPKYLAFLTDRILAFEGKKQIYGTQFKGDGNGRYKPFPIKNIKNLDSLRKKVGLEKFSLYKKKMKALE